MKRSLFCIALAAVLLSMMLPVRAAGALPCRSVEPATQSHASGFSSGYALTGDGALDVVSVALAQLGKKGAEFGYTEEWCADFICDCAIIAGQQAAIPMYGGVEGLKNRILSAGGTFSTDDPRPGDICCIDWDCAGGYDHIEIVYMVSGSLVYTVGGNSGSGPNLYAREVKKHAPLNDGTYGDCITCILRPNYREVSFDCASRCVQYPCYGIADAAPYAALWTQPARDTEEPTSVSAYTCSSDGESFTASRLLRNSSNEYWYRVIKDGETLYIYAGDVRELSFLWDVTAEGISAPTVLAPGSSFSILGTLTTDRLELDRVSSYVYRGIFASGQAVTGTEADVNTPCYHLRLSPLDFGTVFNVLGEGMYTLAYSASARNCFSPDGVTLETETRCFNGLFTGLFFVGASFIPGDADGDGALTTTDALLVLRYSMDIIPSLPRPIAADMDGSGTLDSMDALIILRQAVSR